MCVGIPGKVIEIVDAKTDMALIEIGGVRRAINIACVLDKDRNHAECINEWVLVHVGFAMSRIDESEAMKTLQLLRELGELYDELHTMQST